MSNEQENDQEFDPESLAALARSSITAPPPTKSVPPAAGVKDDSGLLNLKALAEQNAAAEADSGEDAAQPTNGKSAPPPARRESAAPAPRGSSRPAAAAADVAVVASVPAPATVAPPARSNALYYAVAAVAIAAIGGWVYVNQSRRAAEPSEPTGESLSDEAQAADPGEEPANPSPSPEPSPQLAAAPAAPEPTPPGPASPEPPAAEAPATTPTETTPPATAAGSEPAVGGAERDRERDRDRERERAEREQAGASGAAAQGTASAQPAPTPTPAPAPAQPAAEREPAPAGERAATKRGSSVDELLDRALGGRPATGGMGTDQRPARAEQPDEGGAEIPDVPPRGAIQSALGRLRRSVENCANGQVGVARAQVTFASDGSVSAVSIQGAPFAGTPQGTCMERVVRRAHVPRFRRSSLTITYPFSIRPPEP